MEVLTKLKKEILPQINDIPNINCGGCGIAALAIAQWIRQADQRYEPKYIVIWGKTNDNNVSIKKQKRLVDFPHIKVLYNNTSIDSEGTYKVSNDYYHLIIDEQILIDTICKSTWNPEFSREHITDINHIVKFDINEKLK